MKVWTVSLLVAGFLMTIPAANADPGIDEFFSDFIDQEISQCREKAAFVNSRSRNLQNCGKMAIEMANFLAQNKEKLIQAMLRQKMDKKPHKIEHFLIQAFKESRQSPSVVLLGSE